MIKRRVLGDNASLASGNANQSRNFIQRHPWTVLTSLCMCGMCSAMLAIGFLGITIPEIEKQYSMSSTTSGLISAVLDIAFCAVAFMVGFQVSMAAAKRKSGSKLELYWVGLGTLLMAFGAILFIVPVVLYQKNRANDVGIFGDAKFELPADTTCDLNLFSGGGLKSNLQKIVENQYKDNGGGDGNGLVLGLFYVSFAIIGAGSAPIYTLAPVIMKKLTSDRYRVIWLSVFYLFSLAGPSLAYLLGLAFLSKPLMLVQSSSYSNEPFIGAWWLSYLFGSIFTLVVGLITCATIFMYSYRNSFENENNEDDGDDEENFEDDCETRDLLEGNDKTKKKFNFFGSLMILARNWPFVIMCVSSSLSQMLITGFSTFMPKFMENIYDIEPSNSGLVVGGMVIPGALLGSFVGGYVIKRYKMSVKQICLMTAVLSFLCTALLVPTFLVNCDSNRKVVSALPTTDLTGCEKCAANNNTIFSICDEETKTTYLSPCYAGCGSQYTYDNVTKTITFEKCTLSTTNTFKTGKCSKNCKSRYAFFGSFFMDNFLLFAMYVPVTEITIRSVSAKHLAIAIGVQQLLQRLIGHVPGPVLIGKMIDMACARWKHENGLDYTNAFCVFYSFKNYRHNLLFASVPLMFVNTVVMFIAYKLT